MCEDPFRRRSFGWIRHNRSALYAASGMIGLSSTLSRTFTSVAGEAPSDGVIFPFVGVSNQYTMSMCLGLRQPPTWR